MTCNESQSKFGERNRRKTVRYAEDANYSVETAYESVLPYEIRKIIS